MDKISARTNQKLRFDASLHGIDLKAPEMETSSPVKLSKDQRAAMESALEQALSRKRHEVSRG